MGTRGLLVVKNKKGEIKLAEYIGHDSYPSYAGYKIVEFCNNKDNLEKLQKYLENNVKLVEDLYKTSEENIKFCEKHEGVDMLDAIINNFENNKTKLDLICNDLSTKLDVIYAEDHMSFGQDSLFCEWVYMIDFKLNRLTVFKGFNKLPFNQAEEFKTDKPRSGYWGVEELLLFNLDDLPKSKSEFVAPFQKMDLYV